MFKYQVINKKYENFLLNIKEYFQKSDHNIHQARNQLKVISYENKKYVVKAFKIPNFMNQIVYAYIRNSKAKKSYLNAIELIKLSISTPKPIGYIEFYRYKLFKESFYVSEFVEYNFTIREPLRNKTLKNREKIIKEFVRFTYNLHQKGVFHKDFSAGNTLVIIKEDSYDFSIVDINRLELKTITLDLAMKNFDKLWLDEDTLIFIAKEYAKLSGYNEEECINKIIFYDKKLKDFVQKRRKIKKGIFGK